MTKITLRKVFINFPENPGNVEIGRSKSSALKCWLHTAEYFEAWKLARFVHTKSTHCFLRRLAIGLSSFQYGILWSETPLSLHSLLLLLSQPKTTHLSGIFAVEFRFTYKILVSPTTWPNQNKLSFRSIRHKPLAPSLFKGTQHFTRLVLLR